MAEEEGNALGGELWVACLNPCVSELLQEMGALHIG